MNARLDAFLTALDRANLEDLGVLVLPEPDPDLRRAILDRVEAAARAAGPERVTEANRARVAVRELLVRRAAEHGLDVTFAGIPWTSRTPRSEDRARLILAVEDAAVAAALEDILDPDDAAALREPYELAASMPAVAWSGGFDVRNRTPVAIALAVLAAGAGALASLVAGAGALINRSRRPNRD